MPLFKYKVTNPSGAVSEVLIEGDSETDALSRVRQRGLMPLQSLGQVDSYSRSGGFSLLGRKRFDAVEFTNRLVPLLKAHIPLERALGIIADGMEPNDAGRQVVSDLRRGLHEGKKFSVLVRNHSESFPPIYANLVEAGEESGALPEVLAELRRFLNEKRELRNFLLTSSIYPGFILSAVFLVIVFLFTFFIPRFGRIFTDLGKPVPTPTAIMLWISDTITFLWWFWLLCAGGIAYFIHAVRKGGKAKDWWDEKILKLPLFGKLVQTIEISRFIRTLAILIQNQVHLLKTVGIAGRVIQNRTISSSMSGLAGELKGGAKLSKALSKSRYVPKLALQMLAIGEESGEVGDMLNQSADQYEEQLRVQIKRLLALFEPLVIVLLAVVVGAVVFSIFMAIMEINSI